MILYLCEKPSQARDIARHLDTTQKRDGFLEGNHFRVTWCLGHLLALADPAHYCPNIKPWRLEILPIVPQKWQMVILSKTKKQFYIIQKLLKETNHVIIATDADREGEIIARELLEYCHYQGKIERLWLSSLDDLSIQKALKHIKKGEETEALYWAGLGRQQADWLIGMNMTMAASCLYGVNNILSVGRVQTPTLKLVVDRDREIESFKPKNYFVLKALFNGENKTNSVSKETKKIFWATWQAPKTILDEQGYCLDQTLVESVAVKVEGEPGFIKSFKKTKKRQAAPLCFSLSALQKKASALFGFSAKKTLNLVQNLYETHKAITYPRTDSGFLPHDQFSEAYSILNLLEKMDSTLNKWLKLCDLGFRSSVWNDKTVTAHHAMIPTLNEHVNLNNMSQDEFKLYDLIRRYYIAQFLGDYEYLERKIEVLCAGELFMATGYSPIKPGWQQIFQKEPSADEEKNSLPTLKANDSVINEEVKVETKKTTPPSRFTEGTLIEAMKNIGNTVKDKQHQKILKDSHGIGTEATRANILEVLLKRDYLIHQEKQLISTPKGRALIDLVPDSVKNPVTTAIWEQQLDQIANHQGSLDYFIHDQTKILQKMLNELIKESDDKKKSILQLRSDTQNNKVYLCPQCHSPLKPLRNRQGNLFWGCTHYPHCHVTRNDQEGKPI